MPLRVVRINIQGWSKSGFLKISVESPESGCLDFIQGNIERMVFLASRAKKHIRLIRATSGIENINDFVAHNLERNVCHRGGNSLFFRFL